jgi:hypothetical protein
MAKAFEELTIAEVKGLLADLLDSIVVEGHGAGDYRGSLSEAAEALKAGAEGLAALRHTVENFCNLSLFDPDTSV